MGIDKREVIVPTELTSQLCPWRLSKRIVELNGCSTSYFKWVHPYHEFYRVNKRKYIYVEWHRVANRNYYPAYILSELLYYLPIEYIIGHLTDGWFCKDSTDTWTHVIYYTSMVEACAHSYIEVLKANKGKKNEKRANSR